MMATEADAGVPFGMTEEEYERDLDEAIQHEVMLARLYSGRGAIRPPVKQIEDDTDDYPLADIR